MGNHPKGLPHWYSRRFSAAFWRRVKRLEAGANREVYALGVALQHMEEQTLHALLVGEQELALRKKVGGETHG